MPAWLELSSGILLVVLAAYAAAGVGRLSARGHAAEVERRIWSSIALGLLASRLAYLWEFREAYALHPWSVLNLSDGGWSTEWGWVTTWLLMLRHTVVAPALKKPLAWAAAAGTAAWFAGAVVLYATNPDHSVDLPKLTLTSVTGQTIELRALQGRPVVLNLWATWCPPCNREMPLLAQAQADHPEVQFVFADQGESPEQVSRWIAAHSLALRNVVLDPHHQAGAALGQRLFPTTYFFDARGNLVSHRIGALSPATLAEHLRGDSPPPP